MSPQKPAPGQSNDSGISYSSDRRKGDGYIELSVSDDAMAAIANLYPPVGDGQILTPDYAATLLSRLGIGAGVDWDALNEAILGVNTERKAILSFKVASGVAPVNERSESVVPAGRFVGGFKPLGDEDPSVDWKSVSALTLVRKDEAIAEVLPARAGVLGSDVFGVPLPFGKDPASSYGLGKNVERRGDQIVAMCDGRLTLDSKRIAVEETLVIAGDVDYRVGHIMFPGDVLIQGGVAAGFKVYSGGSIAIQQTMDAFDVSAKKDLTCAQGLIGKDQGFVRVGGALKAKFIENARVAVRGDADVPGSIVGSRLYVLGRLNMGDKGRIVGGETYATHGVRCGWIGGATRPATLVNVGMDFTMQQKLDRGNAGLRELAVRIARLDHILKARADDSVSRQRDELRKKAEALARSLEELAKLVDVDESAAVEARSGVHPGVVISICHITITIEQALKKARFSLNRSANKIVVET